MQRAGLLIVALIVCVAGAPLLLGRAWEQAALSEDARLAIELRCGEPEAGSADDCRDTLKRLFLAGSLDPDRTIRAYCDSFKAAPWGGRRPAPPSVCVERYGGWQES